MGKGGELKRMRDADVQESRFGSGGTSVSASPAGSAAASGGLDALFEEQNKGGNVEAHVCSTTV